MRGGFNTGITRIRRKVVVAKIMALATVLLVFVAWAESRQARRFPLGMTINEARAATDARYAVVPFAIDRDVTPGDPEVGNVPEAYMDARDSGLLLYFDSHGKLVETHRLRWFGVNLYQAVDQVRTKVDSWFR